ncbi:MAG: RHS repeat-associated core domain-containing protein [Nitrososphaerota archaeon]|nr:RHS repeat-associated core domain-containing protein [Nitrososphaerota archaeon]
MSHQCDDLNRFIEVSYPSSGGNVNYTYDANGNLMTKSGGWAYSYDYENRLTSVTHSGTVVQQDYYDGDGNRVEQVAGGSTFVYSYQGVNTLYQKNLTSGIVTKSFYAGGVQVAQMVNYTTYYLHQDALGSTVLTMTATVTPAFKAEYVPYGPSYGVTGEEAFQYTGKLLDEATGLYYEGARYYDPETGRFVTEDSYQGDRTDPMTMNLYIYARDNPERYNDPTGHWFVSHIRLAGASALTTGPGITTTSAVIPNSYRMSELWRLSSQTQTYTTSGTTTGETTGTAITDTSHRSPDVTLTESGNSQYGNGLITVTSTTSRETSAATSATNQQFQCITPPPPTSLPEALAGAGTSTFEIYTNAENDALSGQSTLRDALAVGFVTGGWIAAVLGVPEVGIPIVVMTGAVYDSTCP